MYSLKNQVQQQKQSSSVYVRSALNGAAKSQQTSTLSPLPAAASVSASPMRTNAAYAPGKTKPGSLRQSYSIPAFHSKKGFLVD